MKRLFHVKKKYFDSKMKAKAYRDEHGGHVSKGPDHRNYGLHLKDTPHVGSSGHKQGTPTGDGYPSKK